MSGTTEVINVADPPYNAVGDGVTDDTAAIQSAIAAMGGSNGSVLYFPQGTYRISQSLDFSAVPGGQFRVIGAGGTLSKIEVAANNVAAISFNGAGQTQAEISDLGFTVSNLALSGTTAIRMTGTSVTSYMANVNVQNVSIIGYNSGIALTNCLNNTIGNSTIVDTTGSGTGVSLNLAGITTISNVLVGGGVSGSNATGFLVQGSPTTTSLGEGIFMTNCTADGPYIGLQITDTHFGTVTGCSFTSCPGGAVVSANTPGGIGTAAWSFSADEFNASPAAPAVLLDPLTDYNQFTGCWEYSSLYGMQIEGSNNSVTGSQFVLNQAGDVLLDGAGGCNISSNICGSPLPAAFSIAEQPRDGTNPYLNLITGNTVYLPISPPVAGSGTQVTNNLTENPDPSTTTSASPCFATGTRIATTSGDIPVEELRLGDRVRLARGGSAPIVWLGHRHVTCHRHPRPLDAHPVRVRKDAFGPGLPRHDLILSPDHALFLVPPSHDTGVLIPVRCLINGATIVREPVDAITYWHVELASHDILLAEGLPAESYLDTGNRGAFANGATPTHLHPAFARTIWEASACAELVTDGPALHHARAVLLRGGISKESQKFFFEKRTKKLVSVQ